MNIVRWAQPLFNSARIVPKSSKTIARSQKNTPSCEICFYHLGLESPDLSPPLKTCISVTSAIVPTTGNACLKQAAATPLKGKLLMPMIHGPVLQYQLNQNVKKNRILYCQKKELVEVSWNPTWGPEELHV